MNKMAIIKIIFVVYWVFPLSAVLAAQRGSSRNNETPTADQMDPRKQLLRDQAQAAAQKIDEILKDVFNTVNQLDELDAAKMDYADQLIEASRKCLTEFDDRQKSSYFLLQSWVEYHKGDLSHAVMNSGRAGRLGDAGSDTWVSHQFFSVLADKRPFRPRPPRRTNDPSAGGMEMAGQPLYGSAGTLDFKPDSLRHDLLGRTVSSFRVQALDGGSVDFEPGKYALCMLVWQLNTRPEPARGPVSAAPSDRLTSLLQQTTNASPDEHTSPADGQNSLDQQARIMEDLCRTAADSEKIRFVGVNTNAETSRQQVMESLAKAPRPWPQLMITDSEALLPLRSNAQTPFVTVVDPQGSVKFAGSAEGFFLPLLLKKMTGIDFKPRTAQSFAPENLQGQMTPPGEDPNRPPAPHQGVADPNRLIAPPLVVAPTGEEAQYRELPPEEAVQAEKLLTYTRDLFMKAGARRVTTYKRGVELCRQIIHDYSGTVYEAEARQLLRQVPENQRSQYNITNEELGL